ncbi:MAG TPA: hypothetical protein VEK06_00590, partial [Myxococcota bacterium]|nr:hypothetical protein [Myxococcota bacterium]
MIPANPAYSSLNVASAVQIIAYELRMASLQEPSQSPAWDFRVATSAEIQQFFAHLEETLITLDFLKESAPRKLMPRLKRLFLRTRLDVMEINILRGILSAIDEKTSQSHG